jgi:2-dehydropantoate 2-reductase
LGRDKLRILIVGAGAVGGYFGARLLEAGRDVTFLVRPRRRAQLSATGLVVKSPYGDLTLPAPAVLAGEIGGPWNLIILSCKAYDLADAVDAFAPAVGPDTAILPLLNGMRHIEALADRFGREKVLGGTCSIGVTLDPDGAVIHFNRLNKIAFGEWSGGESARVRAVAGLFAQTRTDWTLNTDIIQAMWEKWVLLSTLAASTCLLRANTGDIVSAGGAGLIGAMLNEAQSTAESKGHGAPQETLDSIRELLTDPASSFTASMLRDMERGGQVEADHIIGDLMKRAGAAGLTVPLLELAYLHLKSYDARRRREAGTEAGDAARDNAKV